MEELTREEIIELLMRRDAEMDIIVEANRRLRGHFELEAILEEVMSYTPMVLSAEACSVLLVDPATDDLFFYVTGGEKTFVDMAQITIPRGKGIVGHVIQSGEPLIVPDTSQDHRFFAAVDAQTGFVTRSLLCTPMKVENRVIGAVEVLNKSTGSFGPDDLRLAEIIASQAALAVQYVRANQRQSLDERLTLVGRMAASIIHDLRNSFQLISGFSELLPTEDPSSRRFAGLIGNEITKVIEMCQELLEFSQGSAASTLQFEELSLNTFVRMIEEVNRTRFDKEEIDFEIRVGDDVRLRMDQIKMQRAVQNFVTNARDALEEKKKICIGTRLEAQDAILFIEDTGKGMDVETKKRIFEPFFTFGKPRGTGLGLAITAEIVNAHGGTIDCHSEPGKGTRFEIRLPRIVE